MTHLDAEPIDPPSGWQREHLQRYVATDGADGHYWNGVPTLLLTVHDQAAGRGRRTPLIYGRDGDAYLVVASAGGRPRHPRWYRLLSADPRVRVQVEGHRFDAEAHTASGEERDRLWTLMCGVWPDYDVYQNRTDRQIPVVVLQPVRDR
ncbi:nitroreductase family deazaflavin-dependent oxidoreductase [Rhizomonospora bruguierae]|uniref:nitroreductase family deazaflavin-dependent oxidoreductase n=1 Tax=Rhizomonospora bruguierae TaxID=1581705 RepID=UPI001BCD0810|nr:nitroreductase family deazaflavin-dependent oxidoreductase [Micromonospora sp. NBRC 107566]